MSSKTYSCGRKKTRRSGLDSRVSLAYDRNMDNILEQAIKKAGGTAVLARSLGIRTQAISQWDRVPPARVLDVERITGISRHDLRPDIFGEKKDAA